MHYSLSVNTSDWMSCRAVRKLVALLSLIVYTHIHLRYIFKLNQKGGYWWKCGQNKAKISDVARTSALWNFRFFCYCCCCRSNWIVVLLRSTRSRENALCDKKNFFFCSFRQLRQPNGSVLVFILIYFIYITEKCKAYGLPVDENCHFNGIHLFCLPYQ